MKIIIAIAALFVVMTTACQKDDIAPSKPYPKNDLTGCRLCEGNWDITEPIP